MLIIEITPFEKGVISNSLPKTFSFIFSHIGLALFLLQGFFYFQRALYEKKSAKKVFGKGFGGKPFFRKVSPDKKYDLLYKYHGYEKLFYLIIISFKLSSDASGSSYAFADRSVGL